LEEKAVGLPWALKTLHLGENFRERGEAREDLRDRGEVASPEA